MRISDWSSDVCSSDLQLRKALTTEAKRYDLRIFGREGFALFHFFMCKPHQTFRNVHTHELPREGTEARDARTGFRRLSLWREQRRSGRRRLRHRLVMSRSQQRKAPLRCAGLQQCRMENIERTDGDPPLAQMMTSRFIEMCQQIGRA